jgi:TonB family protein
MSRKTHQILTKIMLLVFMVFSFAVAQKGTMKDPRDGKIYKTVTIGDQDWMAENLNYKTKNSYCYKDVPANCGKYGRLYEWWDAKEACPTGWHLPTQMEFEMLIKTVGGRFAEERLKSPNGWAGGIILGDDFGFSALPGGRRLGGVWNFGNIFEGAYFWSATRKEHNRSNGLYMHIYDSGMDATEKMDISAALSVRCLLGEHSIGDTLEAEAGLFGGSGGGIATKEKGSVKTPSERDIDMGAGGGSRSAADIAKVLRQRVSGLRHIYNKFLKKKPGFQGKVTLKFTIAPGGEVISISIASSTTGYGEFDGEIKSAVNRWTFSKVKSGNTTVRIPFTFAE